MLRFREPDGDNVPYFFKSVISRPDERQPEEKEFWAMQQRRGTVHEFVFTANTN
jgi:hypothetical protein